MLAPPHRGQSGAFPLQNLRANFFCNNRGLLPPIRRAYICCNTVAPVPGDSDTTSRSWGSLVPQWRRHKSAGRDGSVATTARSIVQVEDALHVTLAATLNGMGAKAGLLPLEWSMSIEADGAYVEGRSSPLEPLSMEQAAAWASSLGLTAYSFDPGDGIRTWGSELHGYLIEVSSG